jgi:MFS family permease
MHSHHSHLSRQESKKTYIDFAHNDPENPLNFRPVRKWFITALAVMITILVAAAAGAYAPAIPDLIEEFGCSSEIATLGISLYPLGCIFFKDVNVVGIAPLVLAPLSELQGRNPVYYITFFITASTTVMALLTVVLFIPQAMCRNITTMLIARFLSGLSASVGATMVGGTVADIFDTKDRGTPMNLFGMGSLTGTGLGPFVAGFIYSNENLGWR